MAQRKLSDHQRQHIDKRQREGESWAVLAEDYDTSPGSLRVIIHRWRVQEKERRDAMGGEIVNRVNKRGVNTPISPVETLQSTALTPATQKPVGEKRTHYAALERRVVGMEEHIMKMWKVLDALASRFQPSGGNQHKGSPKRDRVLKVIMDRFAEGERISYAEVAMEADLPSTSSARNNVRLLILDDRLQVEKVKGDHGLIYLAPVEEKEETEG